MVLIFFYTFLKHIPTGGISHETRHTACFILACFWMNMIFHIIFQTLRVTWVIRPSMPVEKFINKCILLLSVPIYAESDF